jgi:K+-transporting ATPase KdpF subunit
MGAADIAALVASILVFLYLCYALFKAERF